MLIWLGVIGALCAVAVLSLREDAETIRSLSTKAASAQRLYLEADRERDNLLLYKRRRETEDARVKKLINSGQILPLPIPR